MEQPKKATWPLAGATAWTESQRLGPPSPRSRVQASPGGDEPRWAVEERSVLWKCDSPGQGKSSDAGINVSSPGACIKNSLFGDCNH